MFKRKLFSNLFFLLLIVVLVAPRLALAQSPWWRPTLKDFSFKVESGGTSDIFGERYTHAQVYWVVYTLMLMLSDPNISKCANTPIDLLRACLEQNAPPTPFNTNSPILQLAAFTDYFSNIKPASGVSYISTTLSKFHILPEAKAQGFGYTTLQPVQKLWQAARNASYSFMIIVILILAFMIMFRQKISPQAVITVQSAIPKIVIAIVLIAFSYAIAGLLIDLSFLVQGVIAALIKQSELSSLTVTDIFSKLQNITMGYFALSYVFVVIAIIFLAGGFLLGKISVLGAIVGSFVSVLGLVLLLVLAIGIVRIFWLLLKTYIVLILLVVISPFYILIDTLPGFLSGGGGISGWMKIFVANLSVFVMAGLLVFVAHFLFWAGASGSAYGPLSSWSAVNPYAIDPNIFGGQAVSLPSFVGVPYGTVGFFLGFAMLLVIPSMANVVKNLLTGQRNEPLGTAIGAAVGTAAGAGFGLVESRKGRDLTRAEQAMEMAKYPERTSEINEIYKRRKEADRLQKLKGFFRQ